MNSSRDPIVAIATAAGRAGIGIVRISGAELEGLVEALCGTSLVARHATLTPFRDANGRVIDTGLAILFRAPHSYTGEHVLELQAHGGPVVLQMLLARCLEAGAGLGLRVAEPGEFTQRALMNDKIDLAQAEAVADLIEASTESAARAAQVSLSGAFSEDVNELVAALIRLRMLVEATLDFPEEEIDFLEQSDARGQLTSICAALVRLRERATQGAILREGLTVVLAGRPNVGKSSLLNALAGAEVAIVTAVPGTTRDRVTSTIEIEGIAFHVIDTAGLRDTEDEVEKIGIERSWQAIEAADLVLHLRDVREPSVQDDEEILRRLPRSVPQRTIYNKIDLVGANARVEGDAIYLSALDGAGIDLLRQQLLAVAGWHSLNEGVFLARARHLEALHAAAVHLEAAEACARSGNGALELLAEELRLAQGALGAITGEFTADELLGEIFSRFCIGK